MWILKRKMICQNKFQFFEQEQVCALLYGIPPYVRSANQNAWLPPNVRRVIFHCVPNKGLYPLRRPAAALLRQKAWPRRSAFCLFYRLTNTALNRSFLSYQGLFSPLPPVSTVFSDYIYIFKLGFSFLFASFPPSVDKGTQGFRSQIARHNCVVLIWNTTSIPALVLLVLPYSLASKTQRP